MPTNYTIRQGDHMARIAHACGFPDWRVLWNHPGNAALRQLRNNPNVLFPGDVLYIPDPQLREEPCQTDDKHHFLKKGSKLKLRLTLLDQYETPIANANCMLTVGVTSRSVTTNGDGRLELEIDPTAREGLLVIQDEGTPLNEARLAFAIGDLDPVEETSGQVARLNNLGYFAGDRSSPDPMAFQSAVEEFQCENGLTVDGICGPLTQAKLKEVHGC